MRVNSRSFTLIELMTVVVLVCIFVVITIPRTNFFQQQNVLTDLHRLFTVFSFVQYKAMASNALQKITFDVEKNSYTYNSLTNKETTVTLSPGNRFGFIQGVKGPPSSPTSIIKKAITFQSPSGETRANLMTNGKILPGTVYIINQKATILCALTCPVSQVSYIRLYVYKNGQWTSLQ